MAKGDWSFVPYGCPNYALINEGGPVLQQTFPLSSGSSQGQPTRPPTARGKNPCIFSLSGSAKKNVQGPLTHPAPTVDKQKFKQIYRKSSGQFKAKRNTIIFDIDNSVSWNKNNICAH